MKVVIAGTGYVGLVTGVCLAEIGHTVTCIDVDPHKIKLLQKGISPIYEKDLEMLMRKNRERLTYTTHYETAYRDATLIFIAVGTPEAPDQSANLTYVYQVAKQIAQTIENDCVIVIKSTVPIGTNKAIETFIKENLTYPVHIEIASNPEFLSQGRAVQDTLHGARIVIGCESPATRDMLEALYQPFNQPIVSTDLTSAEMIKYASNSFLALKISYINEVANLCEKVGATISDVAYGMGLDPRIGNQFLHPGIGYGGSCFPKDTKALCSLSKRHGYTFKLMESVIEVNALQVTRLIEKAYHHYDSLKGLTVAILGLTFKPETDDLRDAPSLKNVQRLLDLGCHIKAYDPVGMENYKHFYPTEITYCQTIESALEAADLCMLFTEWLPIRAFNPSLFSTLMKRPIVLDGRNCYDLIQIASVPIVYESIGRPTINTLPLSPDK